MGGLRKMVGVAREKKVDPRVAEAVACFGSLAVGQAAGAEKPLLMQCLWEVQRRHK